MSRNLIRISKFLSLVLRHRPEKIGIKLDDQGWVDVSQLLAACKQHDRPISRALLDEVVETNNKKRFAFSEDGLRIRANQGHSIKVELGYEAQEPPSTLYHGTATRFLQAIRREGLKKMRRHHVHLSADLDTASKVGVRHGKLAVLVIRSGDMHNDGHQFFRSENGVWLVESVSPEYIDFPGEWV